ncbi:hypothetical protein B0A48_11219 [Cryoendolithus antarcticus]|uniref:Uncharacterized protein n=1 Tax=Cryoendolithus antarcticus TaxID=1507870 RepID=A0A1V8SUV8_9PEZI|nr:hypothetical protein B0A48_11219 [Cryoendolithus antarcticus]
MHIILASTCQHMVSYHFTPPPGYTTSLSPSISFCHSCLEHQELVAMYNKTRPAYIEASAYRKSLTDTSTDTAAKNAAGQKAWNLRRDYFQIATALANAEIYHSQFDDPAYPTLDHLGAVLIPSQQQIEDTYLPSTSKRVQFGATPLPQGRRVHFNVHDEWGTSGKIMTEMSRHSRRYSRGRWALPQGRRYFDTSNGVDQAEWARLGHDDENAVVNPPEVVDVGAAVKAVERSQVDAGIEEDPMEGLEDTSPIDKPIDWQW